MSEFLGLCSWEHQILQGGRFSVLPEAVKTPLTLGAGRGTGRGPQPQVLSHILGMIPLSLGQGRLVSHYQRKTLVFCHNKEGGCRAVLGGDFRV